MHKFWKAAAATVSGVALTFTATMAAEMPANAASGCRITFSSYHTVKKGSHGVQSRAAQCLVKSAGYEVKVNNTFSSAESAQLKKFQRTHQVRVSGTVYASSWTALLSRGSDPSLHVGSRGADVRRLQRSLTATGRRVKVDGIYGANTAKAVRSVQRARHLNVTGTVDHKVWDLLQAGDPIVKKAAHKKAHHATSSSGSRRGKGAKALAFAKRQLGDRYRYGASGPNAWDCSGLTRGAYKAAGVKLPHSARAQYRKGHKVSRSHLKKGDLVFFYRGISHVAIYAGHGKVIHAPRPGKRVSYIKMKYMPFKGARRF
jgi:cell wall-associated NlpC family hydrolase